MDRITQSLKEHYAVKFSQHGETAQGVDWRDQTTMVTRYEKMAAVRLGSEPSSWLDVGCGFGGFGTFLKESKISADYHGVDVVESMVTAARAHHGTNRIMLGDVFSTCFERKYDYVVCNGILTQKLGNSLIEMDEFAMKLIEKMFSISDKGIAFNMMTSYVNFFAPNLYYRNPAECLINVASRFTHKFKIDHSYGLYEFTVYLYH